MRRDHHRTSLCDRTCPTSQQRHAKNWTLDSCGSCQSPRRTSLSKDLADQAWGPNPFAAQRLPLAQMPLSWGQQLSSPLQQLLRLSSAQPSPSSWGLPPWASWRAVSPHFLVLTFSSLSWAAFLPALKPQLHRHPPTSSPHLLSLPLRELVHGS